MPGRLTLVQKIAVCFTAGTVGGLSVVLFSHGLFNLGISTMLGVKAPLTLSPPEVYRPLFWGGLWGVPFALALRFVWPRLYVFGLYYFLAPVAALYFVFLPMKGVSVFGEGADYAFAAYLLVVNAPYGLVTALFTRLITGAKL